MKTKSSGRFSFADFKDTEYITDGCDGFARERGGKRHPYQLLHYKTTIGNPKNPTELSLDLDELRDKLLYKFQSIQLRGPVCDIKYEVDYLSPKGGKYQQFG